MFDQAHNPIRRSTARRNAFTLLEAMVAIGAMALVSVGLAAIFSSVGKTITGGKRLSTLNTYAALVEQQMRRDFDAMSRDGFLMIRNQYTSEGIGGSAKRKAVSLSALSAETPRPRRIDEVLFFAKGSFTTAREAADPDFQAKSGEARIYYGHGMRLPEYLPAFIKPAVADTNARSSAITSASIGLGDQFGPNEYAGAWTLLRNVTLLSKPEATAERFPNHKVFQWDPTTLRGKAVLRDKVGQIALHPAASSIFRVLAGRWPVITTTLSRDYFREEQNRPANRPLFSSGVVDIATTDLNEIRTIVSSVTVLPKDVDQSTSNFQIPNPPKLQNDIQRAQAWMDEAWPAYSDAAAPLYTGRTPEEYPGTRMRYEPAATNYVGVLTSYNTSAKAAEGAYRRADQMLLTASNFVPNCSEFIVEWSFGDVDSDTNEVLWHGFERLADTNGDGVFDGSDRASAIPYPFTPKKKTQIYDYEHSNFDSKIVVYSVPESLIYDRPTVPDLVSQTSYFGYLVPGKTDGMSWPWPRLIRVTFTLSDPNDANIQQTFQFVFETPEVRG